MNLRIYKPIISLATLSFLLTVYHVGGVKRPVSAPQFSTNTVTVDESLSSKKQLSTSVDSRPADNQTVQLLFFLIELILIAALIYFIFVIWLLIRKQQSPSLQRHNTCNVQLQNQLICMLNGDDAAAKRLVRYVKLSNPDRTLDWCLDKVISDLVRDARRACPTGIADNINSW